MLFWKLLVHGCNRNCWYNVILEIAGTIAGAISSQDLLVQPCTGNYWFNVVPAIAGTILSQDLLVQPCIGNNWFNVVPAIAGTILSQDLLIQPLAVYKYKYCSDIKKNAAHSVSLAHRRRGV